MTTDNTRFTEDTFGEPRNARGRPVRRQGLPVYTPEERARHDAIQRAWDIQRDTGDDSELIRLGIYPPRD